MQRSFRPLDGESISKRMTEACAKYYLDNWGFRPLDGESISKRAEVRSNKIKYAAFGVSVP